MTTYNTGNPIGSTDSRDRLDNTENMDYLENSTTELTRLDRLGNVRRTRHGMEVEHDAQIAAHETEHDNQIAAHESEHDAQMQSFENDFDGRLAGMAFTRVGSFTTGATLTDMRQVLIWEVSQGGDGHEYGWAGAFPKVVAAGATPATSGGIGAGAWVDRTDVTLRSDLASESGSGLVGYQPAGTGAAATTVAARMRDHDATPPLLRKPRKLFSKLFASASASAALKHVLLGDSLANVKMQQLLASLDRRMGGASAVGVNTGGNAAGAGVGSAGSDLVASSLVSATFESGSYQYWPTGNVLRIDAGGSASWIVGGVNPRFTTVKVYYVKEPSAGTINLVVGGATVATASANASAGLGVLTLTQAAAQSAISTTVTDASVRVLFVHVTNSGASGVDQYGSMAVGGLLLANATSSAQGLAIWQAALVDIAPDFVTFEMDDEFGDGGANAVAFVTLAGMLDAACPYADKLIIASTPRASNDAGKLAARDYLLNFCANANASYLFFDSYKLLGTYAEMTAIFGSDDGTHPAAAAEAYAAEVMWGFLGLNGFNLGYVSRAVNDPSTPSRLAMNSKFQSYSSDRGTDVTVETDASFGYDWQIKFPRVISFNTRGNYGTSNGVIWQFSGNTAVAPNVMPLTIDFNSAGNVRKLKTNTSSGYEFTQFQKTDNPGGGFMHLQTGMIRSGFTRAELLAISASNVAGAMAFCSDCTGGAQWVYARGTSPTDWVTIDGKTAI